MGVVRKIVLTLREAGFRFLTKKEGEEGWQEMDFPSTFEKVRKLLYVFIHNGMPTVKAEGPPNSAPAADTEACAAEDGAPAVKDILLGPMPPVTAFHPANVTYRQKVSDVALEYKNASKERKKQLPYAVIDDLRKQGYRFLEESNEGVWKEV